MANEDVQKLIIPRAGLAAGESVVRGIHSAAMADIVGKLGEARIHRASNVEPLTGLSLSAFQWLSDNTKGIVSKVHDSVNLLDPALYTKWFADLIPSGGPVLGPCDTREEALAKEEEWLLANGVPVPDTHG